MKPSHHLAFRLAALALVCAAAYHGLALLLPAFARIAYSPGYPVWRHTVFILIDMSLAGMLLWRPVWLIWPYTVLAIQQLKGHGGWAWTVWHRDGRIAWTDIAVVAGVLLIFWLLVIDRRARRSHPT